MYESRKSSLAHCTSLALNSAMVSSNNKKPTQPCSRTCILSPALKLRNDGTDTVFHSSVSDLPKMLSLLKQCFRNESKQLK